MPPPPPPGNDTPLILFDGVCGLCNHWVNHVLAHDRTGCFRFAALQSAPGQHWLRQAGLPVDFLDSIVLVDEAGVWTHSTAILRAMQRLPGWHGLVRLGWLLPRPVRDWGYRWVARRRYLWFGRHETCRLPTAAERARFLS